MRRDDVDYGPFSTEQVLEQIRAREVGLGSMITLLGSDEWEPVGTHELFRDHYAACAAAWEVEEAEQGADRHERQMKAMRVVGGGTWRLGLAGLAVALALGGWFAWRILNAKPTGVLSAVALAAPPTLPAPPTVGAAVPALPIPAATEFAVLKEPVYVSYDTAGVAIEGTEDGEQVVQTLNFDDDSGDELSDAAVERIVAAARRRLEPCALEAATRSETFTGTRMTFWLQSGRLGRLTVGAEVNANPRFKACVKAALSGISVPTFGGQQRKVTVPLRVQR